ncbi:hypothetical protein J2TS4_57230 [Paenibacillus sp. J2TS4]|nr:hypothetical protein J2TS4_57230 [Paenibacillus sp. J2TS4]
MAGWRKENNENLVWVNESYAIQSLGIYGNALLVIPEYNVVAVRMLNQTERNPASYNYLRDIQTFGDMVLERILSQEAIA